MGKGRSVKTQYQPPDRVPTEIEVPLAVPITHRDGSLSEKDSALVNCYIEGDPAGGEIWVRKRPGIESFASFNGGGVATGQGLWVYNGFLLAASGNNLTRVGSPTSSGYTPGSAWTNAFNGTWVPRDFHATAVFKGSLFVIGGRDGALNALADVWSTDDGQNWQQVVSGAPWGARFKMNAVVFNDRLYVIGGISTGGVPYNDVWVTDDGVNWTLVTGQAAWSARYAPACVVYNNGIWILGGNNGAANLNDVWFSTDGSNWVQMVNNAAWSIRSEHKAVVFNDRIYVIGGFAAAGGGREVWWSVDGITWNVATTTAFASNLYAFGCTVYNGAIWVACGFETAVGAKDDIWNSTDGITWNLVTGAYGGAQILGNSLDVFQAPPGTSIIGAPSLYLMGGASTVPTYYNAIWYGNITGSLSTTYVIPSPITAERMQGTPMGFNKYFVIKDTAGMYIWYANEVRRVDNKNYPPLTVPGVVNLDETCYVMNPDGIIFGSSIGNPFEWPSRNYIGADYLSDGGVALARYGLYVMALGVDSLQLFYNSGAPSATLLRPVKNANTKVGCAFPYTVVEFETTVAWVGRTENNRRSVFLMNGMQPMRISNEYIDKIINQPWVSGIELARATSAKIAGHTFYVLSIPGLIYSLAFDVDNKTWQLWRYANSAIGGAWQFNFYATDGIEDYTMDDLNRVVYAWNPQYFLDGTSPINSIIRTRNIDNGTQGIKDVGALTLIGDRVSSITVDFSDDDFQSWGPTTVFNMNQERPRETRFGRYFKRAWRLTHGLNSDFRIQKMIPEIRFGNT